MEGLEYLEVANSPIMWISVLPAVGLVLFQAFKFAKRAYKDGLDMGVSKEQFKVAARSSAIASLGPALVIVIGMVGLLSSVGGPVAWMRLSYIGSVMYELPAADRAATAAGSTLGTANMTLGAYANAVWVMTICALGWIIISALFTDKMGTFRDKVAGGSKVVLTVIAAAGGMGAFGYQVWNRAIPIGTAQTWAVLGSFVVMSLLTYYSKKTGSSWARQFGITISMIAGLIVGSFFL
jgi:hypothetical protein